MGLPQQLHRPLDLLRGRRLRLHDVPAQRAQVRAVRRPVDILGHGEVDGAGPLGLRGLERAPHHLWDGLGGRDVRRPLRDRREHAHQVHELVGLLVVALLADLRGDRDDGRAVRHGVGDAQHQVDRAGPQRCGHHTCRSGEPAVHLRHEGRGLLVPGEDVADLLRAGEGIGETDVLLAGHAEHHLDALVLQAAHQEFGRSVGGLLPVLGVAHADRVLSWVLAAPMGRAGQPSTPALPPGRLRTGSYEPDPLEGVNFQVSFPPHRARLSLGRSGRGWARRS